MGDERNYAGTSFVTPDMFGSYRYGSELLNVTYDPTRREELAAFAYDDDGEFVVLQGFGWFWRREESSPDEDRPLFVTEADDHLFCLITMNHHPLHLNDVYASQSQQGKNVVVGPLVYSLALGMSVSDVSGKAIANLATDDLSHPAPVFHGDTLFAESEVLEVTPSRSKPDRGVVRVHTRVYKQDGTLVAEFKRAVLVPRKEPGNGS